MPSTFQNGLYDLLVDGSLARQLESLSSQSAQLVSPSDLDELRERLVDAVRKELAIAMDGEADSLSETQCLELVNGLLRHCRKGQLAEADIPESPQILTGVQPSGVSFPTIPETGLRSSWLFTAGKGIPSLVSELRAELGAVDRVDILVSFITWSGVRKLKDVFEQITAVGANGQPRTRLRVLTTTYCGNTERRAVDWLAQLPGAEVRISLDGRRSRLHAKAWILHRTTGFGSAYVGSANLSGAALAGGVEWTVKFTQTGDAPLFDRATAHFETLWNDTEFQLYNPANAEQVAALDRALNAEQGSDQNGAITWFGIEPKPYQTELLDRLEAERRHGRKRNLLVAATGTGKTVVAAFDYRRTCEAIGGRPRLLYIAHRKEILVQSRRLFAQVLHDPGFGVLLADGDDPGNYEHCFATIQSLLSKDLVSRCGTTFWHTVIVDECHHAAAASYDKALTQLSPSILLGLTATPERGDGKNILSLFDCRPDGGPAAELRLWQALDQQLLSPFEYYGCADDTDFSDVPWDRADEQKKALEQLLNGNSARANTAIAAFKANVANPRKSRALAFCVSVAHAEFMAEAFMRAGINAEAVTSQTPIERRRGAPTRLAAGEVTVLCTCDLYNEGIDIPSVDTLLFLRPTQSPVVFQQQLGRGLRLYDKKDSCVVIDLVGRHRENFRFDRILAVLAGLPRAGLIEQVEKGFSCLPPGCHLQLDRITRQQVLENLRKAMSQRWSMLARELAGYAALPGKARVEMVQFLTDQGLDLATIYPDRGSQASGWTALRRQAGLIQGEPEPYEQDIGRQLHNLLHHEDPSWLSCTQRVAEGHSTYSTATDADQRRINQLAGQLFPNRNDPCTGEELSNRIAQCPIVSDELAQLAALLDNASDLAEVALPSAPSDWPLCLHARYTLRELMLAIRWLKPNERHVPPAGVLPLHQHKTELLLVTLDKTAGFTSRTSYHDYAISPSLFHWQSQNSCAPSTAAGKRYLNGMADGWTFQLFVRETKRDAYRALGPVSLVSAQGERPMSITWQFQTPLPAALFRKYSVLRDA